MQMLLMREGVTQNGFNITREMILNSLDTFINKPIVLNKGQELNDYTNSEEVNLFNREHVIGVINSVEYIDGVVMGEVVFYQTDNIKKEYDNWQINMSDDKKSFEYCSVELF